MPPGTGPYRPRLIWTAPSTVWSSENPILKVGQIGYETDTRSHKWGDGSTPWNSLPYALAGDGGITSIPPPGHHKVLNLFVNAETGKLEVEYEIPGG